MKINFLKIVVSANKRRGAVVLASLVCLILVTFIPGASQLKTQKRITALQLGDAAEGARVTIVSDSALNDYEAFRRGDRFYVRIPLADFISIPPSFRADGFEDVQVQKVGDSLLISFRLQPGASAHVDLRTNRLDVIFSAPNRTLRNSIASGSNRVTSGGPGTVASRLTDRGPDAAGPMPPGTAPAYSRDGTTYGAGEVYGVRDGRNPRLPFNPSANGNRNPVNQSGSQSANQSGSQSTFGNPAVKSPSPAPSAFASPSSVLSPSTSTSLPAATSATPATSGSYQPSLSASPAGPAVASGASSWRARSDAAMKWMSANRLATLLGVLILLALIVYLVMALGRRRKQQAKAKRLQAPKVQPKIEPAPEPLVQPTVRSHAEPPYSPVSNSQPREFPSARPVASANASTAPAAPVASGQDRPWVLTKPSVSSPTAGPGAASSEEQEREVFEL
jgi:hypothetical protein